MVQNPHIHKIIVENLTKNHINTQFLSKKPGGENTLPSSPVRAVMVKQFLIIIY